MVESKVTNMRQEHDEPPDEPPVGGVPDWTPDQMTPPDEPPEVSVDGLLDVFAARA